MFRAARHIGRLLAIARTLARHDALFPLERMGYARATRWAVRILVGAPGKGSSDKRPGERLADAFEELGPAFIKLGQMLSVRSDVVGEDIAEDLSTLQDHLPPFPGEEARKIITAELDRPVDDVFASFDDMPVAAASIAQVHRAVTRDGEDVAVKVLRPGIEQAFARDVELFAWLAEWAERVQPKLHRLRPVEVVRIFADSVEIEMDLRLEAAAADELRQNLVDEPGFRVPIVHWTRSARRVMTLEWIDGTPIDERDTLIDAGHDLEAIVTCMAKAFFLQVFRDGFFHADLHPGNLLVAADGTIVALDFGIMGRLDRPTRRYLAEMLSSFLMRDYRRVAEVHIMAGYVPATQSVDAFAQAARSIAEPILGLPLREISLARLLAQLFTVTERFEMETQPHLLLLQKTMLVAEGVGRTLHPDVNMWELARPLIEEWVRESMGPEARIRDALVDAWTGLERLPGLVTRLEETMGQVSQGGLKLHPDTVRALAAVRAGRRRRAWPLWLGGAAVAVLIGILIS